LRARRGERRREIGAVTRSPKDASRRAGGKKGEGNQGEESRRQKSLKKGRKRTRDAKKCCRGIWNRKLGEQLTVWGEKEKTAKPLGGGERGEKEGKIG